MIGAAQIGVVAEQVARSLTNWAEGVFTSASAVDWAFVGAAFIILYWLWASLHAATSVGPVEVELLEADSSSDAPVHEITASLREHLKGSGVSAPPGVPAGVPQAKLVAAVEASQIPEAALIGKLIEALPIPQPVQYKLSGTLIGKTPKCGISYWLRPSGPQSALMKTVEGAAFEDLLAPTAYAVYSYISNQATGAFPIWARWHNIEAFTAYRNSDARLQRGDVDGALRELEVAKGREPENALVSLQIASLHEQRAEDDAAKQAEALRRYLDVAVEWPELVEPRYRASVLASGIEASLTPDQRGQPGACIAISAELGAPADRDQLIVWLRRLAEEESIAVIQLLRPWYSFLRFGRPRNQFEPSAQERRRLRRVVCISRHCRRVRGVKTRSRPLAWVEIMRSRVAVQAWHLGFGLISLDWQTHYVAACFQALLLQRAEADAGADSGGS
jgi:hypothetical protein